MKKRAYEDIMRSFLGWFNVTVDDPYEWFVSFLSALIYPVYFILNLQIALNSDVNKLARSSRIEKNNGRKAFKKNERKIIKNLLKTLVRRQRVKALQRKRVELEALETKKKAYSELKSKRLKLYEKCIAYFRVWASRRTKVIEVEVDKVIEKEVVVEKEVEKIVEVEVEVEKTVEVVKEVPVELKVEVPVEVDRIVEVPTEVPVYVDKVKKVPEPYFIKEPEVIIHERLIPVPEDITGAELQELFNAQPRLNEIARNAASQLDSNSFGDPTEEEITRAEPSEKTERRIAEETS
jgi:hypothetical protein